MVELDEYPELSYIGSHGDTGQPEAIDRKARGNQGYREYRYFYPAHTIEEEKHGFSGLGYAKDDAHLHALRAIESDYQLMEDYNNGNWWMCQITATAFLCIEDGRRIECGTASLGGVESDKLDYRAERARELVAEAVTEAGDNTPRLIRQREIEIAALAV